MLLRSRIRIDGESTERISFRDAQSADYLSRAKKCFGTVAVDTAIFRARTANGTARVLPSSGCSASEMRAIDNIEAGSKRRDEEENGLRLSR